MCRRCKRPYNLNNLQLLRHWAKSGLNPRSSSIPRKTALVATRTVLYEGFTMVSDGLEGEASKNCCTHDQVMFGRANHSKCTCIRTTFAFKMLSRTALARSVLENCVEISLPARAALCHHWHWLPKLPSYSQPALRFCAAHMEFNSDIWQNLLTVAR